MYQQYQEMGRRISQRRKELHIKQSTLAEQLGISNNHLSSIENGREHPSLDIFTDICNALNVTPDYLLLGCMHPNDLPQNLADMLRLCEKQDLELIEHILTFFIQKKPINLPPSHLQ